MDDGLKQRLVGAVVLTAVAVIFLPVLFDRQVRPPVDTKTQIPPQPESTASAIAPPSRVADIVPAKPPQTMFQPDEREPVTAEAELPELDEQNIPKAWIIQVASFKAEARATSLRDRLLKDEYKAFYRKVDTGKGVAFRVYVGPKIDKTSAWQAKKAIDKAYKLNTLVLKFKP